MRVADLRSTQCAICGTHDEADEVYPANFDPEAFNVEVFSARRLPDRIRYRLVRCRTCGLVRSDPIADPEVLARLYTESTFTYDSEVPSLRATYGRYLAKLEQFSVNKGAILEIGCGNGFFLEEARAQGYTDVRGVEPSIAAIEKADPTIGPHIVRDIMRPGLFAPETFDVICIFQVFDHLPDPGETLDACFHALKPDGLILCLNHNVEAISARILKERSPIIDIEHTYLYSPATISRIFIDHRFSVLHVGSVRNTYPFHYLARLAPLPDGVKHRVLDALRWRKVGQIPLSVPLGNLYCVAQKPGETGEGEPRKKTRTENFEVFDHDAMSHDGYLYTKSSRLSSQLATQRTTDIILGTERFAGRSVLDIGCGDGHFTMKFWDRGHPKAVVSIDPAKHAIAVANINKGNRPIQFEIGDAHELAYPGNSFDIALIQSVLHHDSDPKDIIREAFRVAPEILIHEPNGNNPVLKLIERISPYHRKHREKSYSSRQLIRWVEECGGKVVDQRFAGFVPMFCPNWFARIAKAIEPIIERLPVVRTLGCAVYMLVARRDE